MRSALGRAAGYAPWSARAWRETAFTAAGVGPAAALPFVMLCAVPYPQFAIVLVPLLPALASVLTAVQRSRFHALLDLHIPPTRHGESWYTPAGIGRRLRSEATWRQVCYHAVVAPTAAVGAVAVVCCWTFGALCAGVLSWAWAVPGTLRLPGWVSGDHVPLTVLGVLLVLAAPPLAHLLTRAETAFAAALLGPSRTRELARRVEDLAVSRAEVVDAADAERRRIERDLHDGAQQRLVSLAMNLGLARATLKDLPPEARSVIDEAHREAKEAIEELNGLVRGLHPAVLEDRGLDAALSGVAARAPLPVRLSVDLPRRPAATVEAVAYFVVSEALANVAKHARASRVEVAVRVRAGRLLVTVEDDGAGGADPSRGTGLSGLAGRVRSVDGTLHLDSPVGGPTVITVELPCAL
ncbi:sensor histidine kinase [Actinacidiphila rubida]|uniref:histidine kinase n=1 Tax=Actinacidiphila rubida TaxID=310780 RepID=A0A1H8F832_9ACTN|nr:sensor histidine kinase [Actinacidiphila rubida]SEN27666.1 Signal transduction histidine kinase [Actinacidiphila rubida]